MNFGLFTTPLAYLNYRKKKAAYDEALAKYEQLKSVADDAVDDYQDQVTELEDQIIGRDEDGSYEQYDNVPDLKVSPLLQVGNLKKNKIKMNAIVMIQNLSDTKDYYINKNLLVQFYLSGYKSKFLAGYNVDGIGTKWRENPVNSGVVEAFNGKYYKIAPGGYIQFETEGSAVGMEYFTREEMKQIREDICAAADVSGVNWLPYGVMIENINVSENVTLSACSWETARAYISGNMVIQTRFMSKMSDCKLQYMGEGWFPNFSGLMDLLFG